MGPRTWEGPGGGCLPQLDQRRIDTPSEIFFAANKSRLLERVVADCE
jgi:hypothetical protein